MIITKQSAITGIIRSLDLNVTPEQVKAWESGTLAQDAFPNLSADEREFMITGVVEEEWDSMFAGAQ